MFKNLRKKVNAVLPDIENIYLSSTASISPSSSSSLSAATNSSSSLSSDSFKFSKSPWPLSSAINFGAGCALLEKNEKLWEELHAANETNAKKAENCDLIIESLSDSINKQLIDLSDINVSLEVIPNIVQNIENCSAIIMDINAKCTEVEKQLFDLQGLMEVLQLQEKQLDSKFEMAMFKERKLANLEKMRQSLLSKHAETVKENEKKMRILQQERQAVFDDAFKNDMSYYKEVGKIPKIDTKSTENTVSLEEIVLENEQENKELDKFLDGL